MHSYQTIWIILSSVIVSPINAVGPTSVRTQVPPLLSDTRTDPPPDLTPERPDIRPISTTDRLWEEVGGVKTTMATISGQLERFNDLYLGKLEHRMLTSSTLLASIDSNIRGLQERSHVWDTFQLHVAAWNDQMKIVDNKMDLLSRGQEKIIVLDAKVSQLMSLEYKLERIAARLEETFQRIHQLETQQRDPLMGEFTTRGVLSTLKIVEKKVDRVQTGVHSIGTTLKGKKKRNETEEASGNLVIRCNTPPAVAEALQDVRAKVDLVYDKLISEGDSNELADEPDNTDLVQSDAKILNKLWKRLTGPQRKMTKSLETIEKLLRGLNSSSCLENDENEEAIRELLSRCRSNDRNVDTLTENSETLVKRVEGIANEVRGISCSSEESVRRSLAEERTRMEEIWKRYQDRKCDKTEEGRRSTTSIPVVPDYGGSGDATDDEGSGDDEDLREGSATGTATIVPSIDFGTRVWTESGESREVASSSATSTTTTIPKIWTPLPVDSRGLPPGWLTTTAIEEIGTTEETIVDVRVDEISCEELASTGKNSGVYRLGTVRDRNAAGRDFYTRNCDLKTTGGGWTVIQQRGGRWLGKENFTRNWDDYKLGFGDIREEFWMGNEYIHRLTYEADVVLRVELEDWDGVSVWAEYSNFRVDGEERDEYRIWISGYEGNATDAFGAHDGTPFSTIDRDNDGAPPCCPCAPAYGGGWWFYSCFEANLNGDYYPENGPHEPFRGMIWEHWRGDYSLKTSRMMVRRRSFGDISLDPPDQIYPDP